MRAGSGELKSLEISDGGRVIARTNGEAITNQEITSAGWYTVKAESTKGRLRYAWVRVTSLNGSLESPIIRVSAGERGSNDWYSSGLKVTIASTDEKASKIHYIINNVNTQARKWRRNMARSKWNRSRNSN